MRKVYFGLFFILNWFFSFGQPTEFLQTLKQLPGVDSVVEVKFDTVFEAQYYLYFKQWINHKDTTSGSFGQRVLLSHQGLDLPMVADLEGYQIWSGQRGELAQLMGCNQLNIEHRFFKDSRPDSIPWDKLTIWQAATDQHIIIQTLQQIYKGNWCSTGISKGGQTTMYHRSFYPNDVQASVPYVAPLNFAREDERIYHFLKTVGTDAERQAIYDFQCACFESKDSLLLLFKEKAKAKDWHFSIGFEKAMDLSILEYSFAYWQWGGYKSEDIPAKEASAKELFEHLYRVSGFTFFEDAELDSFRPFFWAGLTEIGIYGYETKPFVKYLGDTTIYAFDFSAPAGTHPVYNPEAMQQVRTYLDSAANNMLFIVGGLDTWGSTAYVPSGKNNLVRMTLATGHHGTRIYSFPKKDREYMYSLLNSWMGTHIVDPEHKD